MSWQMPCEAQRAQIVKQAHHVSRAPSVKRVHWIAVALCVLGSSAASIAAAHGLPPAALGVASANASGPNLVLLNEGLAVSRAGTWHYLCPTVWGDEDTSAGKVPLALSVDGISTFVIGADDLYVARDGVLSAQEAPELGDGSVIALAADSDALFALRIEGESSAVVQINAEPAQELFSSADYWSELAADAGRIHLARSVSDGELGFMTLDRQGEVLEQFSVPMPGRLDQWQLRPSGERLFAVLFDGMHYSFGKLEEGRWTLLLQSAGPIQGPQLSAGGQRFVAVDGTLMRATDESGDEFEPVGEERAVTCLKHLGELVYACVGTEIHALDDDGLAAELFTLNHLSDPAPELVPAAAASVCEIQWLLFRNDLERTGLAPVDSADPAQADAAVADAAPEVDADASTPATPASRSKGCTTAPVGGPTHGLWSLALVCLALLRRRALVR